MMKYALIGLNGYYLHVHGVKVMKAVATLNPVLTQLEKSVKTFDLLLFFRFSQTVSD